jgi:hypothetical protein
MVSLTKKFKIMLLKALSVGTKTKSSCSLSNSLITSGLLNTEGKVVHTLAVIFTIQDFNINPFRQGV